ncbi:hypothetical protein Tco_0951193 [Tanacetum coccineum]|uniref:Uncharacterized protein n=1 Tax=Tanacetum coccineum TaxID=301880 RepID=A0ABQ5DW65_9ASTR
MRELAVRYKAEKVCHAEMVKMPLVDLKVLEVYPSAYSRSSYRVSTRSDIDCEGPCRLALTKMKESCWNSCKSCKVYSKSKKEYESHLKMNLVLMKKEKCHVKPNKVEAE